MVTPYALKVMPPLIDAWNWPLIVQSLIVTEYCFLVC